LPELATRGAWRWPLRLMRQLVTEQPACALGACVWRFVDRAPASRAICSGMRHLLTAVIAVGIGATCWAVICGVVPRCA